MTTAAKITRVQPRAALPLPATSESEVYQLSEFYEHPTTSSIPLATVMECLSNGEYGDARLFAILFDGHCVYDHIGEEWYVWRGQYWMRDTMREIYHYVGDALPSTYAHACHELDVQLVTMKRQQREIEAAIVPLVRSGDDQDRLVKLRQQETDNTAMQAIIKKQKAALREREIALKNFTRMRNVLTLARSSLGTMADRWDKHPWLLPTAQGVIDLRTGESRDGIPADYIRTVTDTEWKGIDEPCPHFEQFLNECFADKSESERQDTISFLQRALGYGITGLSIEHYFLLLYGPEGRNGKGTVMNTIKNTLGALVGGVSKDVLIGAPRNSNPGAAKPHLVALQGKRIAWAEETDQGERFSAAQVKEITGGGDIVARQLQGHEYSFKPSHLLVLLTNSKPHAPASDAAFWERICPIVYNMRFIDNPNPANPREQKKDSQLENKLQAEKSGILAWLVRGCLEWQRVGMAIPECVIRERAIYKAEEDTLGIFTENACVVGADETVSATELYTCYDAWCDANNVKPLTGTLFGKEITKRFPKKHKMHGWVYEGVRVRVNTDIFTEDDVSLRSALPVASAATMPATPLQRLAIDFPTVSSPQAAPELAPMTPAAQSLLALLPDVVQGPDGTTLSRGNPSIEKAVIHYVVIGQPSLAFQIDKRPPAELAGTALFQAIAGVLKDKRNVARVKKFIQGLATLSVDERS